METVKQTPAAAQLKERLSARQLDMVHYVQKGHDIPQIAESMGLSKQTVVRDLLDAASKFHRAGDDVFTSRLRKLLDQSRRDSRPKRAKAPRKYEGLSKVASVRVVPLDEAKSPNRQERKLKRDFDLFVKVILGKIDVVDKTHSDLAPIKDQPPQFKEDPRWQELEKFAIATKGEGVAARGQELFPELRTPIVSSLALPTKAPENYQGLRGQETPPAFVKRVYGKWLGHGFTKAHIRRLDPVLYTAIDNWLKKPGCEWPKDVDLPTLKEQNDRDFAALSEADGQRLLGKFTAREAGRVAATIARRSHQR